MRALWASFNGVGSVSKDPNSAGGTGSGWTWGYTTALGVAIALDALDPELSREALAGHRHPACSCPLRRVRLDAPRRLQTTTSR